MAIINLFSNAKFWRLGAIALLISTLPIPAMAEATDNSDSVPYRLLLPLLQTFSPPGQATQLLVGAELPELPIDLPTPQSGILKWSLINHPLTPQSEVLQCSLFDQPQSFNLLFEIPQSRSQAEATYLAQLQASGWKTSSPEQLPSELASDPSVPEYTSVVSSVTRVVIGYHDYKADSPLPEPIVFYEQNGDAVLRPYFFQANSGATKLRLDLDMVQPYVDCDPTLPELFLPELFFESAPFDIDQIEWLGGRSGIKDSEVQLRIQTPLSLETQANQFVTLIEQQDWVLQTSSGNNLLRWSVWSSPNELDSSQQVMITWLKTANPNQYIVIFGAQELTWRADLLDSLDFDIPFGALPKATALQILRDRVSLSDNEPYELWVGQLPTGLPAELQMPSEATLLGGAFDTKTATAILETSLNPQDVQTFYHELLTQAGWQASEMFNSAPMYFSSLGFETSGIESLYLSSPKVFCQPEEGTEIALYTQLGPNNLTTIKLNYYPSGELSPCRVDRDFDSITHHHFRADMRDAPVPRLRMPPETTVLQVGKDGGSAYFSSAIYLQTLLSAEALANHYAEQLHQSGWSQLTATQSDGSSVSLWRIETNTGSVWQGLLSLIAQPELGHWAGYFSAISAEQED